MAFALPAHGHAQDQLVFSEGFESGSVCAWTVIAPLPLEICDGRDNDCDGVVDVAASFADGNEPNDDCANVTTLSDIRAPLVIPAVVPGQPTAYPGLDADYYALTILEPNDASCIPVLCQQNYQVTISLTRPPDAPGLQLCASSSTCVAQSCTSGTSRVLTWGGECASNDDQTLYFSVRSPDESSSDCHSYELSITVDYWLSDGTWPGCP